MAPFVELFWEGDFNTVLHQRLVQQVAPNGFVELVIHLSEEHCFLPRLNSWSSSPDYTIIGLYTRPYEVRFFHYVKVFGIRFKPEGIYNLFGVPASEFKESYEDMELVLGGRFKEYCHRLRETKRVESKLKLSEEYLLSKASEQQLDLTYLNRAAELIRKSDTFHKIDDLSGKVYISLRQLEREFLHKIGITPKNYMRLARLNEVHRKLEQGNTLKFTDVAFECGYADQAHFIRDFKTFMGVKPTVFMKEKERFIVNTQSADNL